MDRGISGSGQGFDAPSAGRLGSHAFIPIHNPPSHKMADFIRKVWVLQRVLAMGGGMPRTPQAVMPPAVASQERAHSLTIRWVVRRCDAVAVFVSHWLTLALAICLLLC